MSDFSVLLVDCCCCCSYSEEAQLVDLRAVGVDVEDVGVGLELIS